MLFRSLLKKLYKSWNNSGFISNVNVHKKVISYNFVPNIVFHNNDVYTNPFHNNINNNNNIIMTIEDSVIEHKKIEKSLKLINDRKIEREKIIDMLLDMINQRIEKTRACMLSGFAAKDSEGASRTLIFFVRQIIYI